MNLAENFIEKEVVANPLASAEGGITGPLPPEVVPGNFNEVFTNLGNYISSPAGIQFLQGLGILFLVYIGIKYAYNSRNKLGKVLK